jgi:hypothetical protein
VKIVYTNLREDDSGVVRSVRQLRLDFSKSAEDQSAQAEEQPRTAERKRHLSLVADSRAGDRASEQGTNRDRPGFAHESEGFYRKPEVTRSPVLNSLAAFFINKFVVSGTLGPHNDSVGSLINITV